MMRASRDLVASLLLFAALIGLAAFLGTRQAQNGETQSRPPLYSTRSAEAGGTVALALWLEAMGYRIQRLEDATFGIPSAAKVLFVFPNPYASAGAPFSDSDVNAITEWTRRGNTLVVAVDNALGSSRLGVALMAKSRRLKNTAESLTLEQPMIGDSAARGITLEVTSALEMGRYDYAEYLGAEDMPVLASFSEGPGRVWLTSAPNLFTNSSLRNEANAAVVGALLGPVPRGSLIAFDEYHLRLQSPAVNEGGLSTLVFETPAGWATLFGLLVILVFLFLGGQRLGRPVPLPQARVRRRPAEYVVAMAHLFRRARKRNMARRYYHDWLKHRLAKPHGISPALPDDEFVAALARVSERVDASELSRILGALERERVSDKELVQLADQAVQFSEPQG